MNVRAALMKMFLALSVSNMPENVKITVWVDATTTGGGHIQFEISSGRVFSLDLNYDLLARPAGQLANYIVKWWMEAQMI